MAVVSGFTASLPQPMRKLGSLPAAKHAVAEANRSGPTTPFACTGRMTVPALLMPTHIRRLQAGLRLAGGARMTPPMNRRISVCRQMPHCATDSAGLTPTTAPGVIIIRTTDLARFLPQIPTGGHRHGIVFMGPVDSLEAVGSEIPCRFGSLTDAEQDRWRSKMRELTAGDLDRPIVAVGWNSERFDGRKLRHVSPRSVMPKTDRYRGGREAWEVNGLPETANHP